MYSKLKKTYDPSEVVALLPADDDFDKEDFDDSYITQENSSQDDEDECVEEVEYLKNVNVHQPIKNSESVLSRERNIWENRLPNSDGRRSRLNLIRTRSGKKFILARVDTNFMFLKSCSR